MLSTTFTKRGMQLLLAVFLMALSANAQTTRTTGLESLLKSAPTAALQHIQQSQTMQQSPASSAEKMNNQLKKQKLRFTENKGQLADFNGKLRPDILFTVYSAGVKLFITANGIYYQFSRAFEKEREKNGKESMPSKFDLPGVDSTQFYRLDMQLTGANKHPEITKEGEGSDYENYYSAHCPAGILGVKNYKRITFKNVYPNIDWVVYTSSTHPGLSGGGDEALKYDFVLHPGAKISDIQLQYKGAENITHDKTGSLSVTTPLGIVTEQKPFCFQQAGKEVESRFILKDNTIGFEAKYYDIEKPLIIDPGILWATYYGNVSADYGFSCKTDVEGNVYLGGNTSSASGISSNGFQNIYGGGTRDAFLTKFKPDGTRMWATYYGGSSEDYAYSCAVDNSQNVYLAGYTSSVSGISFKGAQNNYGGSFYDAFLVKFNSSGARIWGTYYGGGGIDFGSCCEVDNHNNVYLCGYTSSINKISYNGFQNTFSGTNDAFLVKFNSSGARIWGTYYGGQKPDYSYSCAADKDGNIYMAGSTVSFNNIAYNGFLNTRVGGNEAFLVKFDSLGFRIWGTYYGGEQSDQALSCITDNNNNIYIAGNSFSDSGIASNGFQNSKRGDYDAFIAKFNSSGNRIWGTYYGGNSFDVANNCATDNNNNVYISGYTSSSNIISYNGFQNTYGGNTDCFVVKFDSICTRIWGSFYGGSNDDRGYGCAVDKNENIFISGFTTSADNISNNGFQNTFGGIYDAFLAKISDCLAAKPTITSDKNFQNVCPKDSVTLTSSDAVSYLWNTGDSGKNIIVKTAGNYYVTVTDLNGCKNASDTAKITYQSCTRPEGLATGNITNSTAQLSWATDTCAIGYQYEVRKKGSFTWITAKITGNSKTITGLAANTTYQWRVIKACRIKPDTLTSLNYAIGPEFTTITFAAAVNNNSTIKTAAVLQAFLYPNPTKDIATVSINNANGKVQVTVSDISGKQLWQSLPTTQRMDKNILQISIPMQYLPSGAYMVQIKDEKETVVVKIVKE